MASTPDRDPTTPRSTLLWLLLLVPLPSLGSWVGLHLAPGEAWAKGVFFASKVFTALGPVVWLLLIARRRPRVPGWSNRGMLAAHLSGVIIFVGIAAAWYGYAQHAVDTQQMRTLMREAGLTTVGLYLLGAVYWCTVNSLFEEYFWRWWVYGRLNRLLPGLVAVVLAGLLFTVHHVIALHAYLPPTLNALASTGVFIGGVTWSWLYHRYGNLYAAYISHVYADLIIFWIGYQIAFG